MTPSATANRVAAAADEMKAARRAAQNRSLKDTPMEGPAFPPETPQEAEEDQEGQYPPQYGSMALFPNEKRHEKQSDYTGTIQIPKAQVPALCEHLLDADEDDRGNVRLTLRAWRYKTKDGRPYVSGTVQEKGKRQTASAEEVGF